MLNMIWEIHLEMILLQAFADEHGHAELREARQRARLRSLPAQYLLPLAEDLLQELNGAQSIDR